ncbi:MAG: RNA polymerase sigma factor RpoH [Desulfuromonadales bacterium]|nr:RNA polymerase sigma factor RpoH [Desulfuromonadales bacterium]
MTTMNFPVVTDTFEHYMAQINQFELLSAKEEHDLACRFRDHGDIDATHRLICSNLRFVVKVAHEYRGYGLRLLDLVQEGNIGLMKAVKKFDPDRGIRLITYAVWWIRAYMHNFIMRSWSMVKIGTTQAQRKLFFKLGQTRNALRNLTGSEDYEEIANELDVNQDVVMEMSQRMGQRDSSLDMQLTDEGDFTLLDTLADERDSQENSLIDKQNRIKLAEKIGEALATLKTREKYIVEQRLLCETPLTLQELADEFGISRERVRQIEQKSLKKLKTALGDITIEDM